MSTFGDFVDLIHSINDKELLEDLLMGITTPNERKEVAQRLEIVKHLLAGEPQQKIAAQLGVGIATVTRGSKALAEGRFKVMKREEK